MRRNLLGPSVLLLLALGGGTLLAVRAAWATATAQAAGLPEVELSVSGADAVPGAAGLAVLVMAAGLGVLAGGPRLRRAIGALVVLAGVVGVFMTARAGDAIATAQRRAIDEAAASGIDVQWSTTVAQPLAVAGFVLVVVVGAAVAWLGPRWATMGRKYDAPAAREPDASDLWKAMDDGVDPTA
ncbi:MULTISPECIES: Trp biosynthesis-associated membrane protein [unclassified Aeromicrobium]|uniref:Trp biosynthesis-associated membrane protein n=1 Tax=unclassified Aeromicrobium TaxID=2633570 RepID=UPI00396B3A1A